MPTRAYIGLCKKIGMLSGVPIFYFLFTAAKQKRGGKILAFGEEKWYN